MSDIIPHTGPVVILLSACQTPGPVLAHSFAKAGAKVIALDEDVKGLAALGALCPDHIEPLIVKGCQVDVLNLLKESWGDVPIDLVVNLLPLAYPNDISKQMRALTTVTRTTAKGLVAGKGCLATVVAQPRDRLALGAQGLLGALSAGSAALAEELEAKSVQVKLVSVPHGKPEVAHDVLVFLSSAGARHVENPVITLR